MERFYIRTLFFALAGSLSFGYVVKASAGESYDVKEVTIQGEAFNCDKALQQAKLLASDSVTGSFLESKRQLLDDHSYSEHINEFSGGLIRSYRVMATDVGPPCRITIKAEVDVAKSNIAVSGDPTALDLGLIGTYVAKQENANLVAQTLIQRPDMMSVKLDNISALALGGNSARLSYDVVEVTPSPKWYSDLESYLKSTSKLHVYNEPSALVEFAKDLISVAMLPVAITWAVLSAPFKDQSAISQNSSKDEGVLCFKTGKDYAQLNCYQSIFAAKTEYLLSKAQLDQQVRFPGNLLGNKRLFSSQFSLVNRVELPISQKKNGVFDTVILPVVEPVGLPSHFQEIVNTDVLKESNGLKVVVRFSK